MNATRKFRPYAFYTLIFLLISAAASCRTQHSVEEETVSDKQSAQNYIAQADKLYAQREDLARLREGITQLRQARTSDFGNYDAAWRLAEYNYYLGMHATDKDERDKAFRDGIEAGKTAIKLQPDKPEGHFWLGANYGGNAETSTIAGLSTIDDIRTEMETVIRLDEGYQSGSAYMALGQLYLETPRMLGGDPQKAVEVMEKGQRFGEDNSLYHLRLAEAYQAVKRNDEARKHLNKVLTMQPDPEYLPEHKEAVEEARKLLDKGV